MSSCGPAVYSGSIPQEIVVKMVLGVCGGSLATDLSMWRVSLVGKWEVS